MQMRSSVVANWFVDAWTLYSRLGVADDADNTHSRRIILANQVAAVVFVLGVGVSTYFLSIT
jgi:hypothetical protein